jgi:hypothetical protein
MKKVFLLFAVALVFVACGPKASTQSEETPIIVDEVEVIDADTTIVVVDEVIEDAAAE